MKSFYLVFSLLISFNTFAGLADLSAEALGCYESVMAPENGDVLKLSRLYAATKMENIVIGLCTYSNAQGALKCYRDAASDESILRAQKNFVNTIALEQKYTRLCSNTRIGKNFKSTTDVDAIDCFKKVMADDQVLASKKSGVAGAAEEEAISLCISSNSKGALTCFKNGMAEKIRIFGSSIDYKSQGALESKVAQLCRGSRL